MPRKVEGVDYSPKGIEDIRKVVIQLRDAALQQNQFEWTTALTHAVALLGYLHELVEERGSDA